jgi:hypothetical protein
MFAISFLLFLPRVCAGHFFHLEKFRMGTAETAVTAWFGK